MSFLHTYVSTIEKVINTSTNVNSIISVTFSFDRIRRTHHLMISFFGSYCHVEMLAHADHVVRVLAFCGEVATVIRRLPQN